MTGKLGELRLPKGMCQFEPVLEREEAELYANLHIPSMEMRKYTARLMETSLALTKEVWPVFDTAVFMGYVFQMIDGSRQRTTASWRRGRNSPATRWKRTL